MTKKTAPLLLSALVLSDARLCHLQAASPLLSVAPGGASVQLSWPVDAVGFRLESLTALAADATWQPVDGAAVPVQNTLRMLVPITDATRFFRLRSEPALLPSTNFQIGRYELISSTSISATVIENTYTATISNWSGQDTTVSATLTAASAPIAIAEAALNFGEIVAGQTTRSTDTFTIRLPADLPLTDSALTWTIQATPLPPTSFALIDAALQSGAINDETALAYKVYAEMDETLLPVAFHGRDDHFDEARAIAELEDRFDSLSPATRQMLTPFLMQPNTPGSWYERKHARLAADRSGAKAAIIWDHVDTDNGKVRVWWNSESSLVEPLAIANEINAKIWPKLTGLFGEAKPDTDNTLLQPDGTVIPDETDDTRLDVFVTESARTFTRQGPCGGDSHASFVNLGVNRSFSTVAHELTHAILYRFPLQTGCDKSSYKWLHEATANWAKHFVYPTLNAEWDSAPEFLEKPELSLDYTEGGSAKLRHAYGAYLWFLFLTRGEDGGAHFVRETWDACAGHDPRGAIEQSITADGGFKKIWPKFALYNWNRGTDDKPYRYYFAWDKLETAAKEEKAIKVALNGKASDKLSLDHLVPNLAAQYFHYDFKDDQTIRSLTFHHPYSEGLFPDAHVYAIVKIVGQDWKEAEDWTPFAKKKLCRDLPSQNFEELVIVISNSEYQNKNNIMGGLNSAELEVSLLGCDTWAGVIHTTHNVTHAAGTTAMSETVNVVFEFDEETTGDGSSGQFYRLQSGDLVYSDQFDSSRNPTCRVLTTASGQLPTNPYKPGVLGGTSANIVFVPGSDPLQYYASGLSIIMIHEEDGCANPPKTTDNAYDHFWWLQSFGTVSTDGKTLEGSQDFPDGIGSVIHYDWKLQKR